MVTAFTLANVHCLHVDPTTWTWSSSTKFPEESRLSGRRSAKCYCKPTTTGDPPLLPPIRMNVVFTRRSTTSTTSSTLLYLLYTPLPPLPPLHSSTLHYPILRIAADLQRSLSTPTPSVPSPLALFSSSHQHTPPSVSDSQKGGLDQGWRRGWGWLPWRPRSDVACVPSSYLPAAAEDPPLVRSCKALYNVEAHRLDTRSQLQVCI